MSWFAVKMIFQIEDKDKIYPQFDEQIRLIEAVNEDLAIEIAHQIGIMEQNELVTTNQQKLNWRFINVTEIQNLGVIEQGKEIHYHVAEPEDVNSYLLMIKEKAESLKKPKQIKY